MENISLIALGFIAFWFLWVNAAWMTATSLTLLPRLFGDYGLMRLLEWGWRLSIVFALGWLLDDYTRNAPHGAWASMELYATVITMSAVMAAPGFLYWREKQTS